METGKSPVHRPYGLRIDSAAFFPARSPGLTSLAPSALCGRGLIFSRGSFGVSLCQRQIHIRNSLVDLLRALEAHRGRVHACILEREPHRLHTIIVAIHELAAAA